MDIRLRAKMVEIRAVKRFRILPRADLSAPGHALLNWLDILIFIKPTPPGFEA